MEALRKCNHCGKKAHTISDLDAFTFGRDRLHSRKNECKPCGYQKRKEAYIKDIYGISKDVYDTRMASSNICAICKTEGELHYDHCHTTGDFRGLLCPKCNKGLGLFQDNTDNLTEAINYLKGVTHGY